MKEIARSRKCLWPCNLALVAVVLLLAACESKEPLRIGFVAGTLGRVADLGVTGLDAAQLAVEQCNQEGGIRGRPVQLIAKDDHQDPDTARKVVRELVAAGVLAVIGPMTSDMAVAPLLNEARLVTVSPTATTEELSGLDDFFFRVTSTTRAFANKSAHYHIQNGTMRRIAAAYDTGNRSFGEKWLYNFTAAFTASGGAMIHTIGFNTNQPATFLQIARDLLAAEPDGILIVANSMDSALLCQQIRKLDTAVPITLADWGATERLLELGGKAVEGVTVVQTFDRDSEAPGYKAFRQAFLERYRREPGFPGVNTYDAMQVVLTALKAQKMGTGLKETILALRRFAGLQGEFEFDPFGDVDRKEASISVVRNQSFVVLE